MITGQIFLYSHDFLLVGRAKSAVKKLLGKQVRGPEQVLASLTRGLSDLHVPYALNESAVGSAEDMGVLSGMDVLAWAIKQKNAEPGRRLAAGPNLAISPQDGNGILLDPAIDAVVLISDWTREYFVKAAPELKDKIYLWPAGVDVPELSPSLKKYDFLLYNKLSNDRLYKQIEEYLVGQKYSIASVSYGNFKQNEYFKLLEQSGSLVYLSETESQGLAMFEAWARNIPTLVYERGFFKHGTITIQGNTASPFLTESAGMRFKDFEQFKRSVDEFKHTVFQPRQYVLDNFTHEHSARKYLEIIQSL